MKGCYTFKSTVEAMNRRFEILMRHERDGSWDEWVEDWQRIFDFRLQQTRIALEKGKPTPKDDGRYWRWHDSGDLQSVEHFASLCRIAEMCPDVDFWLPTKEAGMVRKYLKGKPETAIPTNLCVRISVPLKDRAPEGSLLLLLAMSPQIAFAGCHTDGHHDGGDFIMDGYDEESPVWATMPQECDAYLKDGECADCRDCWDAYNIFVSYPEH